MTLEALSDYFIAEVDPCLSNTFMLTFRYDEATVTIRLKFADEESGTDMIITGVTTHPFTERKSNYANIALQQVLDWADEQNLWSIEAIRVSRRDESFWRRNHFWPIGNPTRDFKFTHTQKRTE